MIKKKNFVQTRFLKTGWGIFLVISVGLIGLVGLFVGSTFNETPPVLFPLDDKQATYKIEKRDNLYWIIYDSKSDKNKSYVCEINRDGKKGCYYEGNNHVEGLIGSSSADLSKYLEKNVAVTGKFVRSDLQCIDKKCSLFGQGSTFIGLDIYTIKEN